MNSGPTKPSYAAGRPADDSGSPQAQASADSFERWVVERSFALVSPICKMTLFILAPLLLIADPVFFIKGYWSSNAQYLYLSVWHLMLASGFLGILITSKFCASHVARTRLLTIFLVFSAGIFSWFGVISWFLTGDFSVYAMVMVCMASLFCFPGALRRVIYVSTTLGISTLIVFLDEKQTFLDSTVYLNLLVILAVTLVIDAHVIKNAQAGFNERRSITPEAPD